MSRSTFTLFIGVFGAALNIFMAFVIIFFTALFNSFFENATDSDESTESSESTEDVAGGTEFLSGLGFLLFVEFFFGFFASMLMIYGVHKERHTYIAPWVFLNGLGLIVQLFYIFSKLGEDESHSLNSFVIVSCILSALIWFPIFNYYKSLKKNNCKTAEVVAATPAVYVAPVATYPSEFSHANAKFVAPCAPSHSQVIYPSVA